MGMFQNNNSNGLSLVLSVLSDIRMFPPRLGGIPPWLNRVFAFSGDVVSGNVLAVEFPAEGLALASELYTNVRATLVQQITWSFPRWRCQYLTSP